MVIKLGTQIYNSDVTSKGKLKLPKLNVCQLEKQVGSNLAKTKKIAKQTTSK